MDRNSLAEQAERLVQSGSRIIVTDTQATEAIHTIVEDYSRLVALLKIANELAEATRGRTRSLGPHEEYAPLDEKKVPLDDPKNPSMGLLEDIRRANKLSETFRLAYRLGSE